MKGIQHKMLLTLLLVMSISVIYIGCIALKGNNIVLDEVKLKETINKKEVFAIMIEQTDGTYKESNSDKWPEDMTFNEALSGCIDAKGNKVENVLEYDNVNKVASVSASGTTYCYLYFEFPVTSYAIYSDTDSSLTFYNNNDMKKLNNVYNDKNVTEVYTGFETANYTSASSVPWNEYATSIKSVSVVDEITPTSLAYWFYGLTNTSTLDLVKLNTSNVTDMSYTFRKTGYSSSTFKTDLSNWDTSSVVKMFEMFRDAGYNATTWEVGDLSNWNTSKVTDMSYIFYGAAWAASEFNLGNLGDWDVQAVKDFNSAFSSAGMKAKEWNIGDLSYWNTSSVTNMQSMFRGSGKAASKFNLGDLSNWNTSSVTNMLFMFQVAGYVATEWYIGTLSNWNTSNVTTMGYMFDQVGAKVTQIELDISNWNVSNVTDMTRMFSYAWPKASYKLDLSKWQVQNVVNYDGFNAGDSGKITPPTWVTPPT